jgi:hypothetical protein
MTLERSEGEGNGSVNGLRLSPAQWAFLVEAARKVDHASLNRPFIFAGEPPERRLERQGIIINTAVSDQDLLDLARVGYLDYRSQERTVLFRDQLRGVEVPAPMAQDRVRHAAGLNILPTRLRLGKHPYVTGLKISLLLTAGVLALIYAFAGASSVAIQTWATIGGLLVATLALAYSQRD